MKLKWLPTTGESKVNYERLATALLKHLMEVSDLLTDLADQNKVHLPYKEWEKQNKQQQKQMTNLWLKNLNMKNRIITTIGKQNGGTGKILEKVKDLSITHSWNRLNEKSNT